MITNTLIFLIYLIVAPQVGFIAPYEWEIVYRKNLKIFKGCHYSRFYIMIPLSFRKIETRNLNSDPPILIFLVLGTKHQLHISNLNIRSDHDIEADLFLYEKNIDLKWDMVQLFWVKTFKGTLMQIWKSFCMLVFIWKQ